MPKYPMMPLGDLCDVLDSKRKPVTKKDRVFGKYPYYGATGILDHVDGYIFDEPLVLVGEDGAKWEAGENTAFSVAGRCWVNNHAHVLRPRRNIAIDKWIIYYLNASDLSPFITGLTVPKLNQAKLREIPIPVPPLPEQKRIVAMLDKAFVGIGTVLANAERNLASARELFDSYLNSIFAHRGEGWVEKRLGEVCSLRSGTTVSNSLEKSYGDLPYLKVADMTIPENTSGVYTSSRFLSRSDINRNGILPIGTTIFPKRGGAIMTNKKRITRTEICTDLNIMGVIPSEALIPEFLFMHFLTVDMRVLGSGSSIPQINNYDIEPLLIAFPTSKVEQGEIVQRLRAMSVESERLKFTYRQKLDSLAALKQAILQKAFAGELTAQSAVQEAAE